MPRPGSRTIPKSKSTTKEVITLGARRVGRSLCRSYQKRLKRFTKKKERICDEEQFLELESKEEEEFFLYLRKISDTKNDLRRLKKLITWRQSFRCCFRNAPRVLVLCT